MGVVALLCASASHQYHSSPIIVAVSACLLTTQATRKNSSGQANLTWTADPTPHLLDPLGISSEILHHSVRPALVIFGLIFRCISRPCLLEQRWGGAHCQRFRLIESALLAGGGNFFCAPQVNISDGIGVECRQSSSRMVERNKRAQV